VERLRVKVDVARKIEAHLDWRRDFCDDPKLTHA
jgi:hypothetical protein